MFCRLDSVVCKYFAHLLLFSKVPKALNIYGSQIHTHLSMFFVFFNHHSNLHWFSVLMEKGYVSLIHVVSRAIKRLETCANCSSSSKNVLPVFWVRKVSNMRLRTVLSPRSHSRRKLSTLPMFACSSCVDIFFFFFLSFFFCLFTSVNVS